MSDPGYLDDVSFGVVSALLIVAYVLHSETFFVTYCKSKSYAASNFLFCNVCQMSNSAHTAVCACRSVITPIKIDRKLLSALVVATCMCVYIFFIYLLLPS